MEATTPRWLRERWAAPLVVVLVCVLAHLGNVTHPFVLDDAYELTRALSDDWREWLFIWNYKVPNEDIPWWWGVEYQRGVVRVIPSALFTAQTHLFGYDPLPFHVVTLGMIAATGVILQRVLARYTRDALAATLATLAVIVHPAVGEIIAQLNCQPLALAGLAAIISVACWTELRATGSRRALVGAWLGAFVALSSYEAVIAFPLLLVGLDLWFLRRRPREAIGGGAWLPRLALVSTLFLYTPLMMWVHSHITAPDYEAVRPLDAVWKSLRIDTLAYFAKVFVIIDPRDQWSYFLLERTGELVTLAIVGTLTAALLVLGRDRRYTVVGVLAFAVTFGPPVLTRSAVSIINLPTWRQIFFPMLFGASVLLAALIIRRTGRARQLAIAAVATFGVAGLVQNILISTVNARRDGLERLTDEVAQIVAGEDPAKKTLVLVGNPVCGFYPSFVWRGPVVRAFPGARDPKADVEVTALDDRTLLGRAPSGFAAVLLDSAAPWPSPPGRYTFGPVHIRRRPMFPPGVTTLRTDGATIELAERQGPKAIGLRAHLDRPLSESIVIHVRGCEAVKKLDLVAPR